ncbi:MAG TPA: ribosome maturation factor RimP [Pyrinomonadaceae bacterium]|nr:ribosome maturation factor RimP [Pyrinomonadaceae bacterium]
MDTSSVEERVREVASRVARERGLELVHVEFAGVGRSAVLRVFIDKPGGVTHEDCSEVSTHVGTVLDVEDVIPGSYTLEVSSPGLERGLYSREDFERFAGHLAKVKTRVPVAGQRNFRGRIVAVEGGEVVFDDKTTGRVRFAADSVAKANLEIDVEEEFRLAEERERQKKAMLSASPDDN